MSDEGGRGGGGFRTAILCKKKTGKVKHLTESHNEQGLQMQTATFSLHFGGTMDYSTLVDRDFQKLQRHGPRKIAVHWLLTNFQQS
jgi:hypothetical protein